MLPKIKILGTRYKDYQGISIFEVPEGTIVQVIDCDPFSSRNNMGDILIRTDNEESPFRSLVGGPNNTYHERNSLWGPAIRGLTFRVLLDKTEEDYPE